MKETVETDAVAVSKATALPKRKASEPFLIPWEGGEAFKISENYILQFYKGRAEKIKKSNYLGKFDDFYSFEEYSISVSEQGSKKYKLYLQITKEHLSVRCDCGHSVKQLCEHAAAVFYREFPSRPMLYFKQLYNEKLLSLPSEFRALLSVKLTSGWDYVGLELKNSSNYGQVYNFNISDRHDWNAWHYSPLPYRGVNITQSKAVKIEFFVLAGELYYGLPYVLPYLEKSKSGRKLSRSYLFYEGEEPDILLADDLFKQNISKNMLDIGEDDNYRIDGNMPMGGESRNNDHIKSLGILNEWRKLISSLKDNEKLCFSDLYGYVKNPSSAKLKEAYRKQDLCISLANGEVRILIDVESNPSYIRLICSIWYKGKRIVEPQFVSAPYCFFLIVAEGFAVFIDDLDMERVIREFRKSNYILTVLDRDSDLFLKECLIPIAQRYELQVQVKGKKGNAVEQVTKPKRIIDVRMTDSHLIAEAWVEYENFGRHPLAPNANVLVRQEGNQYRYAGRCRDLEHDFYDFLQKQHSSWDDLWHENYFFVSRERINETQWLSQFVDRSKAEGIQVNLDKIPVGTSYYPFRLQWEVRQVEFADNRCSILFAPKFRGKVIPISEFAEMVTGVPKVYHLGSHQYGVIQSKDIALFKPLFLSATIEGNYLLLNSVQMISLQTVLEKIDPKIIQGSIRESRERLSKLDEIPEKTLPDTLRASLRPYQQEGFNWMAFLQEFQWGGILADDMGLGKTVQVITLLEHFYMSHGEAPASLVVVPNSLLFNWQAEYQKFAPGRDIIVYHGLGRHQIETFNDNTIVLTTYGTLMSSVDFFESHDFSYLVMDESQNAKNRNSKRFESLEKVNALYRIAMTGTPVENGIQDIYAQMSLVNPGFFGNYRAFNKMYKGVNEEEGKEETLSNLQKMIQPFILRRTKKQVALDLPDKTETTLIVDMLPAQRKVYDKYRKIYQGEVADNLNSTDPSKSKFVAMEALNKLRQICNSPALLKGESFNADSVKLDQIEDILSEVVPGHKVLLFSFFTSMLQLVEERVKAKEIGYAYLDGKLSQQQRQVAVERFQEDESCRVFLISLKAGGTGLNLTAADYVYILDPWWNPAVEAQAIDRCYRIGQEKHVNAYKIVCKDSVEEKILALQEHKRQLADGLILDEANLMKTLSKEELLKLFD